MKILDELFDINADNHIYRDAKSKKFYYSPDGSPGSWEEVPAKYRSQVKAAWENQERLRELQQEDPSYTADDMEREEQERNDAFRKSFDGKSEAQGIEDANKRKEQIRLDKLKSKRDKYKGLNVWNSTPDELGEAIRTFVKNAIQPERKQVIVHTRGYSNPKPGIGRVIRQGPIRQKKTYYEDVEKPLVLVYYDRSGSFGPSDNGSGKSLIGNTILNTLRTFESAGEIVLDVNYFACEVFESEQEAIHDGGTDIGPVLDDIDEHVKALDEGQRINVVILTDRDSSTGENVHPIPIDGSVWIVACESTPEKLWTNFHLANNQSILKVYHYNGTASLV